AGGAGGRDRARPRGPPRERMRLVPRGPGTARRYLDRARPHARGLAPDARRRRAREYRGRDAVVDRRSPALQARRPDAARPALRWRPRRGPDPRGLRELRRAAADRSPRRRVPAAQRALVLALALRRRAALPELRGGWGARRRLVRLRPAHRAVACGRRRDGLVHLRPRG